MTNSLTDTCNQYKDLFKNIPIGIAIYKTPDNGKTFIFQDFNAMAEKIDNIKKAQLIGKDVTKIYPSVVKFGLLDLLRKVYKTGKPKQLPETLYKDGRISGWRKNFIYKDCNGSIVVLFEDVTETKEKEIKIKESQEELQAFFDQAPDAYYIIDKKGMFIDGNNMALTLTKYAKKELVGKHFLESKLLPTSELAKVSAYFVKNLAGKTTRYNTRLQQKNGNIIDLELAGTPVQIRGKKVILGIARDITQRKKTERELLDKNKQLETLIRSMTGREVRIKELKDKIAKLESKLK